MPTNLKYPDLFTNREEWFIDKCGLFINKEEYCQDGFGGGEGKE